MGLKSPTSGAAIGGTVGGPIGPQQFGAGQGPVQATGQAADNPFNNTFNFQIPQASTDGSSMTAPASTGGGGYSQYLPIIIVGVIVAGLGWFLFERKK
jgi:hypothetical protein